MERISTTTAEPDLHGTGKAGFRDGKDFPSDEATSFSSKWCNDVQEEICNVIEDAGYVLNPADNSQLSRAIQTTASIKALVAANGVDVATALARTTEGFSSIESQFCGLRNPHRGAAADVVVAGAAGQIWTFDRAGITSGTWTLRSSGFSGAFFCATHNIPNGGGSGVIVLAGDGGEIQTCPYDGAATWTHRAAAASYTGRWEAGAYGDGLLCLVGVGGEIQTSPDGTTWTHRTAAGSYSGAFRGIAHSTGASGSGGRFVAVGASGAVQTSVDGVTWVAVTTGIVETIVSVAYGLTPAGTSGFILLTESGAMRYSTDAGATWTTMVAPSDGVPTAHKLVFIGGTLCVLAEKMISVALDLQLGIWRTINTNVDMSRSVYGALDIHDPNAANSPYRSIFFGEHGTNQMTGPY